MSYFQLVGSDTPAVVGAAYVVLGSGLRTLRLHVNCPEGTQRTCGEGRIRMARTDGFLFTRIRHDTTMGLPGYVFTIEDGAASGAKGAALNGAPADAQRYGIPLGIAGPTAESVKALWGGLHTMYMRHRSPRHRVNPSFWVPCDDGVVDLCGVGVGTKRERDDAADSGAPKVIVLQFPTGKTTCGYAFLVPTPPPPFSPNAVKSQLGVLPGKKYALLKAGASVESDVTPGRMVSLADLSDNEVGGPSYTLSLFVDGEHDGIVAGVASLVASVAARVGADTIPSKVTVTSCVVLTPADELLGGAPHSGPCVRAANIRAAGERIKASVAVAISSSSSSVRWVLADAMPMSAIYALASVGGGHCGGATAFPTALANRYHLRELAPHYFHIHSSCSHCSQDSAVWPFSLTYNLSDGQCSNAALQKGAAEAPLHVPSPEDARSMLSEDLRQAAARFPSRFAPSQSEEGMLFLGTGSAIPSKYRNVSGLVVDNVVQGAVLRVVCDFGEGSLGQWATSVPREDAAIPLGPEMLSIRAVFLSHSHADHVLGVFSLVDHRQKVLEAVGSDAHRPMLVMCPADMITFFEDMCPVVLTNPGRTSLHRLEVDANAEAIQQLVAASPAGQQHLFLVQTNSPADQYQPPRNADEVLVNPRSLPQIDAFIKAFDTCNGVASYSMTVLPVDHPAYAHALCMRATSGWSWCYSGDGRPSPLLGRVARSHPYAPLDVLVHECTFDDTLTVEAAAKKHSTLSEAISVGQMAGTKHVLLNHFSQRYPKIPHAASQSSPASSEYTFSFDGLCVRYAEGIATGDLCGRLPLFSQLLEEYDSWRVGTSQRLRGGFQN